MKIVARTKCVYRLRPITDDEREQYARVYYPEARFALVDEKDSDIVVEWVKDYNEAIAVVRSIHEDADVEVSDEH